MSISKPFMITALLFAAACGVTKDAPEHANGDTLAADAAPAGPATTGNVIAVEMITDETGSYFKPRDFDAHPGDIVRFTLTTGVHNVHFVADSNNGVAGLPAASDLLQLPGQTYDFTVPNAKDDTKLFFQCDPHALLGMVGTLEIDLD